MVENRLKGGSCDRFGSQDTSRREERVCLFGFPEKTGKNLPATQGGIRIIRERLIGIFVHFPDVLLE